ALSVAFVAFDIRTTPESPVLKWGFVLVRLFTGPIGAMLYVPGCREPLAGTHERYVAAQWRQTLGSTMHCVAGDGVGILAGAVIGGFLLLPGCARHHHGVCLRIRFRIGNLPGPFHARHGRRLVPSRLARSFIRELTSMNCLMDGMIPVAMILKSRIPDATSP